MNYIYTNKLDLYNIQLNNEACLLNKLHKYQQTRCLQYTLINNEACLLNELHKCQQTIQYILFE